MKAAITLLILAAALLGAAVGMLAVAMEPRHFIFGMGAMVLVSLVAWGGLHAWGHGAAPDRGERA